VSRVLVDTSAYSAFMRGDPAIKAALQQAEQIHGAFKLLFNVLIR